MVPNVAISIFYIALTPTSRQWRIDDLEAEKACQIFGIQRELQVGFNFSLKFAYAVLVVCETWLDSKKFSG